MVTTTAGAVLLAFTDALRAIGAFLPRLIGALVVLLIGLVLGRALGALVAGVLRRLGFDRIADRAQIEDFLRGAGVRVDAATVVGELVKWFLYVLFLQVAAATLGIPQLTVVLTAILAFIPRLIVALVIVLLGALAANFLAGVVRGSLAATRLGNAGFLAQVTRWSILAFAVVAALSQLEVAPAIVNTLWTALIGGLGLGLALALGLGLREAAGHIATGQLIKGDFQPGMQIGVDGEGGVVEEVGAVYTTLRTPSGRFKIPNAELARKTVVIAGHDPASRS